MNSTRRADDCHRFFFGWGLFVAFGASNVSRTHTHRLTRNECECGPIVRAQAPFATEARRAQLRDSQASRRARVHLRAPIFALRARTHRESVHKCVHNCLLYVRRRRRRDGYNFRALFPRSNPPPPSLASTLNTPSAMRALV